MSTSGQNLFKGIDYQKSVNLLYLLENFQYQNFLKITSEEKNFSDITLHFNNIFKEDKGYFFNIEVKYRTNGLALSEVESIIKKEIDERGDLYQDNNYFSTDKFLIISNKFPKGLLQNIDKIKTNYYIYKAGHNDLDLPQNLKEWIQEDEVALFLQNTTLIELTEEEISSRIKLFFQYTDTYLYEENGLEYIINTLDNSIEEASRGGLGLDRNSIELIINDFKERSLQRAPALKEPLGNTVEKIIDLHRKGKLINALNDDLQLSEFSAKQQSIFQIIEIIKDNTDDYPLKKIIKIFQNILLKYRYIYNCFELLEKYISQDNLDSILEISFESFKINKRDGHSCHRIFEFLLKLYKHKSFLESKHLERHKRSIFDFLDRSTPNLFKNKQNGLDDDSSLDLLDQSNNSFYYELVSEILENLFKNSSDSEKIIQFIFQKFNFIKDRGISSNSNLLQGLSEYIENFIDQNFKENFPKIIEKTKEQFQIYFKKEYGIDYVGEEFTGGFIGFDGDFKYDELPIVGILEKSIVDFYSNSQDWEFLSKFTKVEQVAFVQRAFIPFLLDQLVKCQDPKLLSQFEIVLKNILKQTKGSPAPLEVASCYLLRNLDKFKDIDFFKPMISFITYDIYNKKLPYYDHYLIRILIKLTADGKEDFSKYLKDIFHSCHAWYKEDILKNLSSKMNNPYIKKFIEENIDADQKELFFTRISTSWKNNKTTYDILLKNKLQNASKDDLRRLASFIEQAMSDASSDKHKIIQKTSKIIIPYMTKDNREKFEASSFFMTTLARLAGKMIKLEQIDLAEKIIDFCINSKNIFNDDYLNTHQDLNKNIIQGQEEVMITTMRGHLSWALQSYVVATFKYSEKDNCSKTGIEKANKMREKSFNWVKQIIDLENKFFKDIKGYPTPNYYLMLQALIPLRMLVSFSIRKQMNEYRGLGDAVKKYCFDLLRFTKEDIKEKQYNPKYFLNMLARVFNKVRDLNTEEAKEVLTFFKEKEVQDSNHLFIYYALFRRDHFKKNDLNDSKAKKIPFDDTYFKKLLGDMCKEKSNSFKKSIAFTMYQGINIKDKENTEKEAIDFFEKIKPYWELLFEDFDISITLELSYSLECILEKEEYYKKYKKYLFKMIDKLIEEGKHVDISLISWTKKIIPSMKKYEESDIAEVLLKFLTAGNKIQGRMHYQYEARQDWIPAFKEVKDSITDKKLVEEVSKLLKDYNL